MVAKTELESTQVLKLNNFGIKRSKKNLRISRKLRQLNVVGEDYHRKIELQKQKDKKFKRLALRLANIDLITGESKLPQFGPKNKPKRTRSEIDSIINLKVGWYNYDHFPFKRFLKRPLLKFKREIEKAFYRIRNIRGKRETECWRSQRKTYENQKNQGIENIQLPVVPSIFAKSEYKNWSEKTNKEKKRKVKTTKPIDQVLSSAK